MRTLLDEWMNKHLSKSTRHWVWFALLWCGGLGAVLLLGYAIRLAMGIE